MHDRNGTQLKKGDTVLIEAVIVDLSATEDYCNVSVESTSGRRPDGLKEKICSINTAVLILKESAHVCEYKDYGEDMDPNEHCSCGKTRPRTRS